MFNPACDQEKSSVTSCSYKNHTFGNIAHKNMMRHFNAKRMLYYNAFIIAIEQTKIMRKFLSEIE